jgi:glutamate/aspartate transport system substrate-binding protein
MGYIPKRCAPAASLLAAWFCGHGRGRPDRRQRRAEPDACQYQEGACRAPQAIASSPPFSFLDQANRPIGYSLELCEAIVDEIGVEVDDANLKIEYVKVTSTTAFRRWCRTKSISNADRPRPMPSAVNRWHSRR